MITVLFFANDGLKSSKMCIFSRLYRLRHRIFMLKQVFEIIIIIIDLEVAHPHRQTNSDSPGKQASTTIHI